MTQKTKLIILIPVGAAILNGLGYLVAINVRTPAKVAAPAAGVQSAQAVEDRRLAPAAATPRADRDDKEREERALARRAAGVAALEAGDYDRAVAAFAEARSLAGDKAYVSELMRVAEDLAHRQQPATAPAVRRPVSTRAPVAAPVARVAVRPRIVERERERVAAQEPAPPPPPAEAPPAPAAAPASSGLLLVTTTPRGLLVQVDDVPVDLTPTRASLKVGPHHVALLDGERKVYETNVEVKAGSPTTLLRDLSAAVATPAPTRATSPSLAKEEVLAPSAPSPSESPPLVPAPQAETLPAASPRAARTGALQITSPGLYGEVWINGRPRGFPPLLADDLPPGPARIGVRVNGVEERSTTVAVRPGMTTPVRLSR